MYVCISIYQPTDTLMPSYIATSIHIYIIYMHAYIYVYIHAAVPKHALNKTSRSVHTHGIYI